MTKILFICHGNICRSPMAEFLFRDMLEREHLSERVEVASAAVSSEEIGQPVYPPARRLLRERGISCDGKTARRVTAAEYGDWDLLIGMDENNLRRMRLVFGGDPEGKCFRLLHFAGEEADISDPWYTGDFKRAESDILRGLNGLIRAIKTKGVNEHGKAFGRNRRDPEKRLQHHDRVLP